MPIPIGVQWDQRGSRASDNRSTGGSGAPRLRATRHSPGSPVAETLAAIALGISRSLSLTAGCLATLERSNAVSEPTLDNREAGGLP